MIPGYGDQWAEAEKLSEMFGKPGRSLAMIDLGVASALEDRAWTLNAWRSSKRSNSCNGGTDDSAKTFGDAHPEVTRNLNYLGQVLGIEATCSRGCGAEAVLALPAQTLGDDRAATLETSPASTKVLNVKGNGPTQKPVA